MANPRNFNLLLILYNLLLLLNLADSKCRKSFECGRLGSLQFPLTRDSGCGLFMVDDCDSDHPKIQLEAGRRWYDILHNVSTNSFFVRDPELQRMMDERSCFSFENLSLPKSPYSSFIVSPNLTLFTCFNQPYEVDLRHRFENYNEQNCTPFSLYYKDPSIEGGEVDTHTLPQCTISEVPMESGETHDWSSGLFNLLAAEFKLEWYVSPGCYNCHHRGGQCLTTSMNEFVCKIEDSKVKLILIIAGSLAALLVLLFSLISYLVWLRKKRSNGSYLLSRNISSNHSSKSDIEGGSFNFGIPIFSYSELEKATNFFDPSKELGDGGFGTVYYGKLGDGREVAIKRLYEHNYKRVEQFLNEIKILTGLRHPNLVSLYGCTSRRSRELLLVYEYISNGTVADHLHGERAKEAPLTWPVRMSIAIETASALAYLHNSDIIHRDVKTNNILLDSNFSVKVADFGLSRLFPTDVTHISTAPQGTPGYVDPEYHQCYQLTDKSDVYSFGVVLAELISSMAAVDISRHRHEINLANLALNRIQRCAFDELIDPSLGYDSDPEVTRMTTSVAELAFRCLQLEKDMRPCMDEVVCFLKGIQGGEDCNFEQMKGADGNRTAPRKIPPSPETDEAVLLKNKDFKSSPTAVTDTWVSGSTTTSSIE